MAFYGPGRSYRRNRDKYLARFMHTFKLVSMGRKRGAVVTGIYNGGSEGGGGTVLLNLGAITSDNVQA